MTLSDLEKQVSLEEKGNLLMSQQVDIDAKVLKLLAKCIRSGMKIDLSEIDLVRIGKMYYHVYQRYDLEFLKQVASYSVNCLDFYKVLNLLNNFL